LEHLTSPVAAAAAVAELLVLSVLALQALVRLPYTAPEEVEASGPDQARVEEELDQLLEEEEADGNETRSSPDPFFGTFAALADQKHA
jgi:hypothetical protein